MSPPIRGGVRAETGAHDRMDIPVLSSLSIASYPIYPKLFKSLGLYYTMVPMVNIDVSRKTHRKLKKLKKVEELKTLDAAIRILLEKYYHDWEVHENH